MQFNLETRKFEGEPLKYVLDVNGHAIGDFNMVDARYGMVIERDNNEGLLRQACTGGSTGPQGRTCFEEPLARFKRVFLIDMQAGPDMVAKKVAYIDLLDIKVRVLRTHAVVTLLCVQKRASLVVAGCMHASSDNSAQRCI